MFLWERRLSIFQKSNLQKHGAYNNQVGEESRITSKKSATPKDEQEWDKTGQNHTSLSSHFFAITELTDYIFELCLITDEEWSSDDVSSPQNTLLRVCRMWRETALCNPNLWTKIELSYCSGIRNRTLVYRHSGIISSWLRRSKNVPVSIKLNYPGRCPGDIGCISSIFAPLLLHANRWKDIDIIAPMSCIKPILRHIGETTPILESCRFGITSTSERADVALLTGSTSFRLDALEINIERTPRLKEIVLCSDVLTDTTFSELPASLQNIGLKNIEPIYKDGIQTRLSSLKFTKF